MEKINKRKIFIRIYIPLITIIFLASIFTGFCVTYGNATQTMLFGKPKMAEKYGLSNNADGGTIFLGDSITQMYDLNFYFKDKGYINRGISGDRTDETLKRLDSNVIKFSPSKIIFMVGVNDLGAKIDITSICNNYTAIFNALTTALPNAEIFVQSIYPVCHTGSLLSNISVGARKNQDIIALNIELEKISESFNFIFIDMFSALSTPENTLYKPYTIEGLHLNGKGYEKVTEVLSAYGF